MIVREKIGNLNSFDLKDRPIDWLELEWYEAGKRILHKKTNSGVELVMKFLSGNQQLTQGDVIFESQATIIAIDILTCDTIVIRPATMFEMASVCYEIGNKHLPLFFEEDQLLIPFDMPLYNLLSAHGFKIEKAKRKLLHPLRTTVTPHGQTSETLFSKILKMTASNE